MKDRIFDNKQKSTEFESDVAENFIDYFYKVIL